MIFVLDTDTCVFWLRGNSRVRDRVLAAGPNGIAISIVTVAELRYGADCSPQPDANHQAIDAFLTGVAVLELDQAVARVFGEVKTDLRGRGLLIQDFDILIAATALVQGMGVATNNVKHFQRVSNLPVENWAKADSDDV